MFLKMGLLDRLAAQSGCEYLSDLRRLEKGARVRLAGILREVASGDAALEEWNDALRYLTGEPPASTPEAARQTLIERLLAGGP